jgi:hypothetical protein
MAVTVGSVVTKARAVLQDTTSVRWPDDELIGWINDGQREIALIKPDASSKNETMAMIPGTKQSLPAGALRLLRVVRNMIDAGANVGGRAIRLVSREILDAQQPDWHDPEVRGESEFGNLVKHYMYDEQDPQHFYVYPGISNDYTGALIPHIEIIYSANPDDVTQMSDPISIPDLYQNAILNYVLYMAYMKDAEYAGNAQRASSHYQIFTASVTGKGQIDVITTPNLESRSNPNLTASA